MIKSILFSVVLLFSFTISTNAQIHQGDVNLNTQSQVDNLMNITQITGSLLIEGAYISNLSALSSLESIGGNLIIKNNPSFNNLDALENLTSMNGFIYINNNKFLNSIEGLKNINPSGIFENNGYPAISIINNDRVPTCAITPVCAVLSNNQSFYVYDNGTNCNSIASIQDECNSNICAVPTNVTSSVNGRQILISYDSPVGSTIDIKAGTSPAQVANPQDNRLEFRNRTDNPIVSPILTANTQYFWRIRSDCSGTGADNSFVSAWSGVYTATTNSSSPVIELNEATSKISVYPNPASSSIKILGFEAVRVNVYNMQGTNVLSKDLDENKSLDINKLRSGSYTLELIDKDGITKRKQLMKK